MTTAQRTRTGTWGQIFPNEQVTAQQSVVFVKKLLAVAVSNITYLRNIFPEYAFGDRCLEDLNLKILKDDSPCTGACQVIKWVKGCFDALEKKYLRMIVIGIYIDPDNPDTVIESYTFKFNYTEDGGVDIYRNQDKISGAHSAAETKKATIRLLRTLVILSSSLHSLPDDVFMSMKLLYYDDVTPPDYQPPGFQDSDIPGFNFDDEPMNIKVGDVDTPFHTLKVRLKTDGRQFENPEGPSQQEAQSVLDQSSQIGEEPMEETSSVVENVGVVSQVSTNNGGLQVVPEPAEGAVPKQSPTAPGSDMRAVSTTGSQLVSQQSQEDCGINCCCGYNEDDGLMIMCAVCQTWQHAVCFRVLHENEAPTRHICDRCDDPNNPNQKATDPLLLTFTDIAKEAVCLWRRALFVCQETNKIMAVNLAKRLGVELTVAQGLVARLEKEGFIKGGKSKKHGKLVNKEKLKEGFKKYLAKEEEEKSSEPQVTSSQRNATEKKNRVNNEIDRIIARAENINLAGQRKLVTKDDPPQLSQSQPMSSEPTQPVVKQDRGRKRVKATSGDGEDFEVSNSQEASQNGHPNEAKRRKTSVVRKSLRV